MKNREEILKCIADQLEPFFFIGSPEELAIKFQEAMDWMMELRERGSWVAS
jgi:hypothetical protein